MLLRIQYSVFLFIRGICQLVQVLRFILGYVFSTRRCKSDKRFLNKQRSINTDVYFGNVCLPFIYFFLLMVLRKSIHPSIICKQAMFLFQMYSKLIFIFLVCWQPQRKVGVDYPINTLPDEWLILFAFVLWYTKDHLAGHCGLPCRAHCRSPCGLPCMLP